MRIGEPELIRDADGPYLKPPILAKEVHLDMSQAKPSHSIGENWVTHPNRNLEAIELEFDNTAALYDEKSEEWGYRGARDGASWLLRFASADSRILDAGCGTGLVGAELARRGATELWGCDISQNMLNVARTKKVYADKLVKADLCAIPFRDEFFDSLICVAVLTYAPAIAKVMREFHRLVRLEDSSASLIALTLRTSAASPRLSRKSRWPMRGRS